MAKGKKLKEKIEEYLSSGDRQMVKLGQKLCHAHRIDYYICEWPEGSVMRYSVKAIEPYVILKVYHGRSTGPAEETRMPIKVHKIILNEKTKRENRELSQLSR